MRILTLFVRHGTAKYGEVLDDLLTFYRRQLPSVVHDVVVVDNAMQEPLVSPVGRPTFIAGSNRFWEFSAWDEALAHVGRRAWDYDYVHLATSAFRTLYTRYLDRFAGPMLERVAGRGVAIGHIDYYNEPVQLLGYRSQQWLRSCFMFLPPAELATLGPLVGVSNAARFFSGDPARPFRADAPISETYQRYILDWLTGPGTGQGVTWHSRFLVTAESLLYFQAKVLAMLNEHMLAIRLRRQGCMLVDATWLATQIASSGRSAAVATIPYWRVQLAERDTDAVPLPSEQGSI
jgi:hypothetical protein